MKFEVVKGDITRERVDAIVNAANPALLGGGGVDGAIHRAAGGGLLAECRAIYGGCKTGEAVLTKGYNLEAAFVIHTVGPVWHGGTNREAELLERCYRNSISLAERNGIRTIAFPNVSTGVYGFPKTAAADVVSGYFHPLAEGNSFIERVVFVCFDDENFELYRERFAD